MPENLIHTPQSVSASLEELHDANDRLRIAQIQSAEARQAAARKLTSLIGRQLALKGQISEHIIISEDKSYRRTAESEDCKLLPNLYTICDVSERVVYLATKGEEKLRQSVISLDTLSTATPEELLQTHELYPPQRQAMNKPVA